MRTDRPAILAGTPCYRVALLILIGLVSLTGCDVREGAGPTAASATPAAAGRPTLAPSADSPTAPASPPPAGALARAGATPTPSPASAVTPSPRPAITQILELAFLDPRHGWLLAAACAGGGQCPVALRETDDGGGSWQEVAIPTDGERWNVRLLQAGPTGELWLLSGGQGATIHQSKRLSISPDGGRHWRLVADAPFSPPGQVVGSLPLSGHVYQNSGQLAVVSATHAFLALGRGTLMRTSDGGYSWAEALPYQRANRGDNAMGPVHFVDPRHGWLATSPNRLLRTSDGGQAWQEVTVE